MMNKKQQAQEDAYLKALLGDLATPGYYTQPLNVSVPCSLNVDAKIVRPTSAPASN